MKNIQYILIIGVLVLITSGNQQDEQYNESTSNKEYIIQNGTQQYQQQQDDNGLNGKVSFRHPLEMIRSMGFQPEIHEIITEDKYILTAWRITNSNQTTRNIPVLIQHGLMDLSFSWFIHRIRDRCLPTMLADIGYDVWVLNNRGNRYTRNKTNTNTSNKYKRQKRFWDFSYQELAKYDVTANIKYIQKITGKSKIHYIGHSQGTTQFIAKIIEDINFQQNIETFIGISPVVFVSNLKSKFIQSLSNMKITQFLEKFGIQGIYSPPGIYNPIQGAICKAKPIQQFIISLLKEFCGPYTGHNWDSTTMSTICTYEPGGTSARSLEHFVQNYKKKGFFYFDYENETLNIKHYSQKTPPSYPLQNLLLWKIPTLFIRGNQDYFSTQEDFQYLLSLMPNNQDNLIQQININEYSHLEVLWAQDAYLTTFQPILKYLESY